MSAKLTVAVASLLISTHSVANSDVIKMQQAKSLPIAVTKSSNHIDFTPQKQYDKYIISVAGPNGFSKSIETDTPSLDVSSLNLPSDGTFNYQIKAVTHLQEIKDTLNNGRSADARGFISKVDITSGKFTTENFAVKTFEQAAEKKPIKEAKLTKEMH